MLCWETCWSWRPNSTQHKCRELQWSMLDRKEKFLQHWNYEYANVHSDCGNCWIRSRAGQAFWHSFRDVLGRHIEIFKADQRQLNASQQLVIVNDAITYIRTYLPVSGLNFSRDQYKMFSNGLHPCLKIFSLSLFFFFLKVVIALNLEGAGPDF